MIKQRLLEAIKKGNISVNWKTDSLLADIDVKGDHFWIDEPEIKESITAFKMNDTIEYAVVNGMGRHSKITSSLKEAKDFLLNIYINYLTDNDE